MERDTVRDPESYKLREFVTAMVLNSQVTAEIAGLRAVDLYVLNLLDMSGRLTAGELAKRTALTTGAITKLIDRLARSGLVERLPDLDDRRRVLLQLTDTSAWVGEGADLFSPLAKRMNVLISSFPREQREVLLEFLDRATDEIQLATCELQEKGRPPREE